MSAGRTRTIALLAGLAAVVVAVAVGLNWREIYYAFHPEARFFGRWRRVTTGEPAEGIFVFGEDGVFRIEGRGSMVLHGAPAPYRVTASHVVFDGRTWATYRPEGDGGVVLDFPDRRRWTLVRQ